MDDTPTIAAARRFLALINEGDPPSNGELLLALDKLAMAYHETPDTEPADADANPPKSDYQERHRSLSQRFPEYGYYAVADPTEPVQDEPLVGDAIDDLADISGDLEQVLWRFEHLGVDDAHWHFRMLYEIHWGRHLRELALYLHLKFADSWMRAGV